MPSYGVYVAPANIEEFRQQLKETATWLKEKGYPTISDEQLAEVELSEAYKIFTTAGNLYPWGVYFSSEKRSDVLAFRDVVTTTIEKNRVPTALGYEEYDGKRLPDILKERDGLRQAIVNAIADLKKMPRVKGGGALRSLLQEVLHIRMFT